MNHEALILEAMRRPEYREGLKPMLGHSAPEATADIYLGGPGSVRQSGQAPVPPESGPNTE